MIIFTAKSLLENPYCEANTQSSKALELRIKTMISIRPSAVAGLYYPARSTELEDLLTKQFDNPSDHIHHRAKALIVPHGGFFYSGQVAAKLISL